MVDGNFQVDLDGLKIGSNEITVVAYEGSEEVGRTTVDAKLELAKTTATATFADDLEETVTVSGTATPKTDVKVMHGEKTLATVESDDSGKWSTPVNAPDMGGTYDLTVAQHVQGENHESIDLSIDYGAGIAIADPKDDFVLDPGEKLDVSGSGQYGSEVRITEKGKPDTVLGTAKVAANNTWAAHDIELEDREYTLVASAISKGYNTTSAEVTVNPGKTGETRALSVETPTDGSTTANRTPYFMGWGQKNATITITDGDGTEIGSTTVDENGWWGKVSAKTLPDGEHTFTITQTAGKQVETVARKVTIDSIRNLTIDSPTADSTSWWPKPSLIGWGTPGGTVTITDETGATLGTETINGDGWFGINSSKSLSDGKHTLTFTQTANGATNSVGVPITIAHKPLQIDSPQDGGSSWWPNPSFVGWATPGAEIEVYDTDDTTRVARTTANDEGWFGVVSERPLSYGWHTLHFRQTYNGATTTAKTTYTIAADPLRIEQPTEGYQNWWPKPSFIGWATAGAQVRVSDSDGTLITTATANSEGWFGEISPKALSVGEHALQFQQVINGQNVGDPTVVTITITEN